MAFQVNLVVDQGSTFRKTFTYKTGTTPTPVNLTGCTAKCQLRTAPSSEVVLLELTTVNGGIILGGVNGTIELFITDEQSALLSSALVVYDVLITFTNGDVKRILEGNISIRPGVTRG